MIAPLLALSLHSIQLDVTLPEPATAIAVSPDGGFAAGDKTGVVREFDSEGHLTASFIEQGPICALAYSPDGKLLATGFRDDGRNVTNAIWTKDGKLVRYFDALKRTPPKPQSEMRMYSFVWSSRLAWSPDGQTLATEHGGHLDTGVRLWRVTGELKAELGRHWPAGKEPFPMAAGVKALEFSPSGDSLMTSMDDGYVRLWNADGSLRWQSVVTKNEPVIDADFTSGGKEIYFVTMPEKSRIGAMKAESGKMEWLASTDAGLWAIRSLPDNGIFAVSNQGILTFEQGRTDKPLARVGPGIECIALNADRTVEYVATANSHILVRPRE